MKFLIPILTLLFLTSCRSEILTVYTEYINPDRLASYHVRTPDPKLNCPDIGQRLHIKWKVPKEWMNCEDLHIQLVIHFKNREKVSERIDLKDRRGAAIYELYNDDYFRTCGILMYKVDLMSGDQILEEWRHQIWVELIELEADE